GARRARAAHLLRRRSERMHRSRGRPRLRAAVHVRGRVRRMIARVVLAAAAAVAAAAVFAVAGCGPDHIRDPDDFSPAPPIDPEPSFGVPLAEGSQLRFTFVSSTSRWGTGYVYVYEGPGWDADVRSVGAEATLYR